MPTSGVYIIGEPGACHDGDLEKAFQLIHIAAQAGCQSIKWQFWSSPERMAERRNAPDKLWAFRKHQLPVEWLLPLKAAAEKQGIENMVTCYLPEDLDLIAPIVSRLKIGSFESTDREFILANLGWGKPTIISTGMMGRGEIEVLRNFVYGDVSLLLCVSAYPTPMEELNLYAMDELDGLSDHTANVLTGALAAARGASIIEVHFRLASTSSDNPDYLHSLTPSDLTRYIANVRLAEAALGDGEKRVMPSERRWMKYRVRA